MSYMEQELYYILGNILKNAREDARLTLTEVSEKMGTTPMTVQRYEKGDRKISVEKVRELCGIYGQDADQIMKRLSTNSKNLVLNPPPSPHITTMTSGPMRSLQRLKTLRAMLRVRENRCGCGIDLDKQGEYKRAKNIIQL